MNSLKYIVGIVTITYVAYVCFFTLDMLIRSGFFYIISDVDLLGFWRETFFIPSVVFGLGMLIYKKFINFEINAILEHLSNFIFKSVFIIYLIIVFANIIDHFIHMDKIHVNYFYLIIDVFIWSTVIYLLSRKRKVT